MHHLEEHVAADAVHDEVVLAVVALEVAPLPLHRVVQAGVDGLVHAGVVEHASPEVVEGVGVLHAPVVRAALHVAAVALAQKVLVRVAHLDEQNLGACVTGGRDGHG
jgi:hypothetical protein